MCRTFGTLPSPGGILDQDPYLISGMNTVMLAVHEKHERDKRNQTPSRVGR